MYECAECGEEQYVAQPCCADPSAKELFSVSVSETSFLVQYASLAWFVCHAVISFNPHCN